MIQFDEHIFQTGWWKTTTWTKFNSYKVLKIEAIPKKERDCFWRNLFSGGELLNFGNVIRYIKGIQVNGKIAPPKKGSEEW